MSNKRSFIYHPWFIGGLYIGLFFMIIVYPLYSFIGHVMRSNDFEEECYKQSPFDKSLATGDAFVRRECYLALSTAASSIGGVPKVDSTFFSSFWDGHKNVELEKLKKCPKCSTDLHENYIPEDLRRSMMINRWK